MEAHRRKPSSGMLLPTKKAAVLGALLASLVGLGAVHMLSESRQISVRLQNAVGQFNETALLSPTDAALQRSAILSDLFEVDAEIQVRSRNISGQSGLAQLVTEMARRYQKLNISLSSAEIKASEGKATAEFQIMISGNDGLELRSERRGAYARLIQNPSGQWRIRMLQVSGPDESDPEARP